MGGRGEAFGVSLSETASSADLFILFIYLFSLMLTITEQILFTIRNSKMLIDVNTLVKKTKKSI